MTSHEFNERYREYLEKGHYGLAIDHPEIVDFLDQTFQDLIKIEGFQYSQIKMKFGQARVYTNLSSPIPSLIEMHINEIYKEITSEKKDVD